MLPGNVKISVMIKAHQNVARTHFGTQGGREREGGREGGREAGDARKPVVSERALTARTTTTAMHRGTAQ